MNICKSEKSLQSILNRHRSVVEQVAHGVMEYKEDVHESGIKTIEEEKIQYFLDRFYMSRIAIRVLINQHGKGFKITKGFEYRIPKDTFSTA